MIFDKPIEFADAMRSRAVKVLLPTSLNSKELAGVDAALRERATFSARVENAHFLQKVDEMIASIVNPRQVIRAPGEAPVTEGETQQSAREALRSVLNSMGYAPEPGKEGTMEDLSSDARLDLIVRTNTELAQGYGNWKAGQNKDVLLVFPATELKRVESREVPRGTKEGYPNFYWQRRWLGLGGKLYNGRMIARKDDPILSKVSEFGLPYGPPGFNSGYEWEDVRVDEARALGVLGKSDRVKPQEREFEKDMEASGRGLGTALRAALLKDLGKGYKFKHGVLSSTTGGEGRVMNYGNESRLVEGYFSMPPATRWPDKERTVAHGLHIIIEHPKGSVRSGTSPDGKAWSVTMPADYGEIHGFRGADGDYVDCYVGDSPGDNVLVIDQCDIFQPGRPFDEHKCFVDFASAGEARQAYLHAYTDGRGAERIAGETQMGMAEFKAWLRDKAKTKRPTLQAANAHSLNAALITQLDNERLIANAEVRVKAHVRVTAGGPVLVSQHERTIVKGSVEHLKSLRPALAVAAQKVYDGWEQDEEGMDPELGAGGICQDIAGEMADALNAQGIDAATVSAQIGDQHVWVVAKTRDGVYNVDIHPSVYKTGGGYTWKKREGVTFDFSDVSVDLLDHNPESFDSYTEEG